MWKSFENIGLQTSEKVSWEKKETCAKHKIDRSQNGRSNKTSCMHVCQIRLDEVLTRSRRRLFQMQSSSVDSPERQRHQLQQQQCVAHRSIIPSLSITLPDGNIQSLDTSPLCPINSPHSHGTTTIILTSEHRVKVI